MRDRAESSNCGILAGSPSTRPQPRWTCHPERASGNGVSRAPGCTAKCKRVVPMTPEQWERIKELVDAGLDCEGDARARFLDEACAGDPSLRAEVCQLIASHERAGNFMAVSGCDAATELFAEDRDASLVGRRIGPYRNVRELGQ